MARELVDLDDSASWTLLGVVGQSTITIVKSPATGRVLLNTTNVESGDEFGATETAQLVTPNRLNDQFSQNSSTEQLFGRATSDGWQVIVDQV